MILKTRILPLVSSLIVFMMMVMISDGIVHKLYPVAESSEVNNATYMASFIAGLDNGAFIILGAGWGFAALLSGIILGRLSAATWKSNAIIVGSITTIMLSVNLVILPFHPTWLNILGPMMPLPLTYYGASLFGKKVMKSR